MDGEDQPAKVRCESGAKPVGEIRARWAWMEPCVWTERMLTALENGVKGGRWAIWPNAYFAEHGLFSMFAAYQYVCQSARR